MQILRSAPRRFLHRQPVRLKQKSKYFAVEDSYHPKTGFGSHLYDALPDDARTYPFLTEKDLQGCKKPPRRCRMFAREYV